MNKRFLSVVLAWTACGLLACGDSSNMTSPTNPNPPGAQGNDRRPDPPPSPRAAAGGPPKVIIGYVFPKKPIDPAEIAAEKLTHVNYAFANVVDGAVVLANDRDKENLHQLTTLRGKNPELKLLISVGGWTWSGGFSDAAQGAESRAKFVKSAVEVVTQNDLDGLDVDWEYPGLPGIGNTHRPEDKQNFTHLMAELRTGLDAAGAEHHKHFLLTFAAGALPQYLDHTEMSHVQTSVDFVNLMTYDFREAEGDPVAGHHANLLAHPSDPKKLSVDRMVHAFLAAGVPAAKLVVGVPFYGHAWGDVKPEDQGLYQPGKPVREPLDTTYTGLADKIAGQDGYVRVWDEKAQAPFLWNSEKHVFISYEDTQSLRQKCKFIRENQLGGAMFWEYYADARGDLLGTLYTELRGGAPAK